MKKVISSERLPIKMWTDNMEKGALEQTKNLANLPFARKWIAIMPDTHQGYGMPIGGVMATDNVIVPNAVGVDIGCGMCAVKTSLKDIETETVKQIMGEIRKVVPLGFDHQDAKQDKSLMPKIEGDMPIVKQQYESALRQLGTLGGGNHFIEIQKGDDGYIWIMVHSGSRNLGHKIATEYNKQAQKINEKYYSVVDKKQELAFLPIEDGKTYMREMNYAVDFAFANRKLMIDRIKAIFNYEFSDIEFDDMINIAHNYAKFENHFGKNYIIHRKGATSAYEGELGIIPGSQGESSYIVKGLGNEKSFKSCSHGAGRVMGRRQAQRTLNLEKEKKSLDDKGVIHSIRNKKDLDEAPSAYKDIDEVMEKQKDLVEIVTTLRPIAVIKG